MILKMLPPHLLRSFIMGYQRGERKMAFADCLKSFYDNGIRLRGWGHLKVHWMCEGFVWGFFACLFVVGSVWFGFMILFSGVLGNLVLNFGP